MIETIPFWRETPLSTAESLLLELVHEAHVASCGRHNVSRDLFEAGAFGSGSYVNGLIAALASLGGPHGPIEQTVAVLQDPDQIGQMLAFGGKVPGWGNSFEKGHKDPLWLTVDECLKLNFSEMSTRLESITDELHRAGKNLYPNPSAYTSATALIVGLPARTAAYLFIHARLDGWTKLYLHT